MTPRLKILSVMLALSVVYSVYDYMERNKSKKPVVKKTKARKRPGTARVSQTRAIDLQKKMNAQNKNNNKVSFTAQKEFLPLSDELTYLDGWSRNPFMDAYTPVLKPKITTTENEKIVKEIIENSAITSLDGLIIETAVRMGEKAFVTINGQTFQEGDLINDALIEKIENEQITFKVGKTKIIKDVGT
mgnify:FL=1|tara:strand:+ start:333 stop:896 length:564 start_codon:yes stop_codon:yes gene_type:complete